MFFANVVNISLDEADSLGRCDLHFGPPVLKVNVSIDKRKRKQSSCYSHGSVS